MDRKDVKVGMKVMPFQKTYCSDFEAWKKTHPMQLAYLDEHGFLIVTQVCMDDVHFCLDSEDKSGDGNNVFHASDFSPAEIEVGDTVRTPSSGDGIVIGITKGRPPILVEHFTSKNYMHDGSGGGLSCKSGHGWYYNMRELTLLRKAKPEPVSKRPKLEDINERTLVKTRAGEMAFITLFMGEHKLTTKRIVDDGNLLFLCSAIYGGENSDNDVVATKLVDTQMRAIRHVMTSTEPAWDWTEDMDKPQPLTLTNSEARAMLGALDGQRIFIDGKEIG